MVRITVLRHGTGLLRRCVFATRFTQAMWDFDEVVAISEKLEAFKKGCGQRVLTLCLNDLERANRILGELLRATKRATKTKVRGGLDTDRAPTSWMVRHCCGFTAGFMCDQTLGPLGEVVWARVPGTRLLRGKFEVNCLELVWLGKTENSDEHLCGDLHGVHKFRTNQAAACDCQKGGCQQALRRLYPKPMRKIAAGGAEPLGHKRVFPFCRHSIAIERLRSGVSSTFRESSRDSDGAQAR